MKRVYSCDLAKRADLTKILEADPYASDSFARLGYKLREGSSLGEDKNKLYLYLSADDNFIKNADSKLKDIALPVKGTDEKRIIEKIQKEEEEAKHGFGSIFGE